MQNDLYRAGVKEVLLLLFFSLFFSPSLTANHFDSFHVRGAVKQVHEEGPRGTTRVVADTLPIAYYALATYYITPPDFKKLSLKALRNLDDHVPGLAFKYVGNKIKVYMKQQLLMTTPHLPASDNYKAWVNVLLNIVDFLDEKDFLKHKHADVILVALLEGLVKPLDKMTKYVSVVPRNEQNAAVKKPHKNLKVSSTMIGDVLHLKIPYFGENSCLKAIQLLQSSPYKGLILDVRDNVGGDLTQAVALADAFLNKGTIAKSKGRHPAATQHFIADSKDYLNAKPMVVLVDQHTASAAEMLAVTLKSTKRALIVGTETYGKGTIQNVQLLPNGGALHLTWGKLYGPKGLDWDKKGLDPDIDVRNIKGTIGKLSDYDVSFDIEADVKVGYILLMHPKLYAIIINK